MHTNHNDTNTTVTVVHATRVKVVYSVVYLVVDYYDEQFNEVVNINVTKVHNEFYNSGCYLVVF